MIIPAGYAQANFIFGGAALPNGAETTIGFDVSAGGRTPTQMALELSAAWDSSGMDLILSANVALTSILVKFGPNDTGPSGIWSGSIPGGAAGNTSPPNTTWLVQKVTGSGGRSGRGRMYLPGVPENGVGNDGQIDSGTIAAHQLRLNAFLGAITTSNYEPVLLHGAASGIPITSPLPITALTLNSRVATQRRRLRR